MPEDFPPTVTTLSPFVNENLLRAENRINVTLFGAQAIHPFWQRVCERMDFPQGAWLDRVVLAKTSLRPDFLVMHDDQKLCWIEVELGIGMRTKLLPMAPNSTHQKLSR